MESKSLDFWLQPHYKVKIHFFSCHESVSSHIQKTDALYLIDTTKRCMHRCTIIHAQAHTHSFTGTIVNQGHAASLNMPESHLIHHFTFKCRNKAGLHRCMPITLAIRRQKLKGGGCLQITRPAWAAWYTWYLISKKFKWRKYRDNYKQGEWVFFSDCYTSCVKHLPTVCHVLSCVSYSFYINELFTVILKVGIVFLKMRKLRFS